jgi:hypothetical protein
MTSAAAMMRFREQRIRDPGVWRPRERCQAAPVDDERRCDCVFSPQQIRRSWGMATRERCQGAPVASLLDRDDLPARERGARC